MIKADLRSRAGHSRTRTNLYMTPLAARCRASLTDVQRTLHA